jgi:hypothetical protein
MEREHIIDETCRIRTVTPARLGRQDKANWRSRTPFGRKGLSAHWILQVFATSKQRGARCAGAALRTFPMNFNLPSDGARNVRPGGAPLFLCHHARWCDLMRSMLGSSCVGLFPRPIVALWHVMIAKISGSGLADPATVEHASIRGRNRSSSRPRSQSAKQVAILSEWARPVAGKEARRVGSTRAAEVRRSLHRFLETAGAVAGNEILRVGFERGGSSSRPGWSGSIRRSGARELRRCAER